MKKKGFTLIEILAVIVVLGLLAAIITPTVNKLLGDSEEQLEKEQINKIITATKKYVVENSNILPDINSDKEVIIKTTTLIEKGVINGDKIINPNTKNEIDGCVKIKYDKNYNQYNYEYSEQCDN